MKRVEQDATTLLVGLHSISRPLKGYNESMVKDRQEDSFSMLIDEISCEIKAIELAEKPDALGLIALTELGKWRREDDPESQFEVEVIQQSVFKITNNRKTQKRRRQ